MQTNTSIKKNRCSILTIIGLSLMIFAVVCLIIGAFLDYDISKLIAGTTPNNTTSWGARFSFLPGFICGIFIAFLLTFTIFTIQSKIKTKNLKILYFIFAYLIVLTLCSFQFFDGFIRELWGSFQLDGNNSFNYHPIWVLYGCLSSLFFVGYSTLLIHFTNLKKFTINTIKPCLFIIVTILMVWLTMILVKTNVPRERYYVGEGKGTYANPDEFRAWYSLLWNRIEGSGFQYQSFPSGHTCWGVTCMLIIPFLYYVFSVRKNYAIIPIASILFIFLIITMLARIEAGYHYLSDTTMMVFIFSAGYLTNNFLYNHI